MDTHWLRIPHPHPYPSTPLVVATVAVSAAFVGACGVDTAPREILRSEQLSKSTFAGTWPVVPESGLLACDTSQANAITFTPTGSSTTYAVNSDALTQAPREGWSDTTMIATGADWRSFIDAGMKLCSDIAMANG